MTWTLLSRAAADDAGRPSPRANHGFASAGGLLYAHGGLGVNGEALGYLLYNHCSATEEIIVKSLLSIVKTSCVISFHCKNIAYTLYIHFDIHL